MYNQGYRPQPGQTKSGYYDSQGNWYVPAPGQARPAQPQKRRASRPPRGTQPPRPPRDSGGKPRKPRKKRSLKWQLIKVLLVLILLAGAGVYGYIWKIQSDVRPYLNVFLDNVSVDGIDLSGLTWAEGSQLVWDHVNQKQNGWYVRLRNTNGQYKDITAQTLGISFDPTAALNAAWAIGHDVDGEERKDIFQLQEEIERLRRRRTPSTAPSRARIPPRLTRSCKRWRRQPTASPATRISSASIPTTEKSLHLSAGGLWPEAGHHRRARADSADGSEPGKRRGAA